MSFTKMLSNVGLRLQPCRTPTKGVNVTLIINDRVTKYLDEHNIIHNSQIVFRKGYRTSDHVFVLKTLIELNTKNDKKVYACFVDFQRPMTRFGETAFSIS